MTHQHGLQQMQGEHGTSACSRSGPVVAVFAVEQHGVAGVPVLHHCNPLWISHRKSGEATKSQGKVVRTALPSSSSVSQVECVGPPRVYRRRIDSESAVQSRRAVAYLTIWSYCWAMSSHVIGLVSTAPVPSGRPSRMEPMFCSSICPQ
jgi:hypothetical protein